MWRKHTGVGIGIAIAAAGAAVGVIAAGAPAMADVAGRITELGEVSPRPLECRFKSWASASALAGPEGHTRLGRSDRNS